jgi:hypothetical protein
MYELPPMKKRLGIDMLMDQMLSRRANLLLLTRRECGLQASCMVFQID